MYLWLWEKYITSGACLFSSFVTDSNKLSITYSENELNKKGSAVMHRNTQSG